MEARLPAGGRPLPPLTPYASWHGRDVLLRFPFLGQVAQLVEQRTENPRVGGSIPSLAIVAVCYGWGHRLRQRRAADRA
jgi:hypothetical protein